MKPDMMPCLVRGLHSAVFLGGRCFTGSHYARTERDVGGVSGDWLWKTWRTVGIGESRASTRCFRRIVTRWLMTRAGESGRTSNSIRSVQDSSCIRHCHIDRTESMNLQQSVTLRYGVSIQCIIRYISSSSVTWWVEYCHVDGTSPENMILGLPYVSLQEAPSTLMDL